MDRPTRFELAMNSFADCRLNRLATDDIGVGDRIRTRTSTLEESHATVKHHTHENGREHRIRTDLRFCLQDRRPPQAVPFPELVRNVRLELTTLCL